MGRVVLSLSICLVASVAVVASAHAVSSDSAEVNDQENGIPKKSTQSVAAVQISIVPDELVETVPSDLDLASYFLVAKQGFTTKLTMQLELREHQGEESIYDFWTFGVVAYGGMLSTKNRPVLLEPIYQKSGEFRASVGFGEDDFLTLASQMDQDIRSFSIGGRFVEAERTGLGGEASLAKVRSKTLAGVPWQSTTFRIGALYYVPVVDGLIARVRWSQYDSDPGASARGFGFGAEFYTEVGKGHWLNAEVMIDLTGFENDIWNDDELTELSMRVDFYPQKELGFGVTWVSADWDGTDVLSSVDMHAIYSFGKWDLRVFWIETEDEIFNEDYVTYGIGLDARF